MDCGTKPQSSDLRGRGSSPASLLQDFSDGMLSGTCAVGSLAATTFRLLLPLSPSSGQIDSTTRVLGGAELLGGQGWPRNLLERVAPLWLHQICATRTVVGDRQPDFLSPTRGHSQSLHQEFKWSTSLSTVVFYFKNQTF